MDISYNWLKEYVKFDLNPDQVAEALTNIGLEVEHQDIVEEIPGGLEGVVTAHVVECVPHPNSDHLHVTKVDCGTGELLQVVCGAPNVAEGQKVLLATLNTKLVIGGEEIKIKKSKIRGVESCGMICAEDELGIGSDHAGIMVLPADTPVGVKAKDYLNLKSDTVYTIGLTPNRIDAASFIGVARDLSAWLRLNNLGGELTLPSVDGFKAPQTDNGSVDIVVNQPEGAPRYSGLTIRGITVKESPDWMKKKLLSVGFRPINNIVDITNYILIETGNPMHAFDVDKIKGGKIVVDFCPEGTPFTTLDGVERKLSGQDLMICNSEAPMCIAGVFGGLDSGVKMADGEKPGTTSVFLESAYFNPVLIRKTSKRHTLKTEASFRYERGCDPNMVPYALKRAAMLVLELAGGEIAGPVKDVVSKPIEKKVVELDYARMESLMGCKIGNEKIHQILDYLEMEFVSESETGCVVKVPTYRVDVYRECDVVEDVLRIYGYNNVPLPGSMKCS
ncbi:MAG: phenylalanine--tRNA ligase subunit beta, partial [Bacteroidales bacterium]|nr:phenylalanine--tRNA ligase subunit beta [Bacteroidales bacterium]